MTEKTLPQKLQKALAESKGRAFRELTIERAGAFDAEARTVDVAFASETPVQRWYGREILDMNSSSIRLDRLRDGGAVLMDHNWTDQVGVTGDVRIGGDKVARAKLRFGRSVRASEIMQDVGDGIRTKISFGYQVHAAVLESSDENGETYRITDWEPYEISFVSVPADVSVGVGRAQPEPASPKEKPMSEAPVVTRTEPNPADLAAQQRAGGDAERKRVTEILAIADAYKRHNLGELAAEHVRSGASVDDFRAKAMERMSSKPLSTAEIGMNDREKRRYSFVRAMAALAHPEVPSIRAQAAFELECSAAAQERMKTTRGTGITIPFDVLNRGHALMQQQRDLTAGGSTTGAPLIETDLLDQDFITLLRNRMVITQLGVQTLTGLQGNIAIPRQTGAATAYWLGENTAPTESDQATDQVPMSPKTVGAWTDISRRLLLQSSIDVESMVQTDLATVLALAIQSAAIQGGGSNQPTGVLGTSGIGSVVGGTNGAQPTFANMVALETAIASANADIGSLAYLTNAKARGFLKTQPKLGTTMPIYTWGEGDAPLNGYKAAVTNAVPSNLTKGTANGICSAILFGNWSDLIIGMWGGLDLMVDPYSKSTTGAVRVTVFQDCDIAVRHKESFAAMNDALTS